MELGERDCQRLGCPGTVELSADSLNELIECTAKGQCDACGQHYEVELIIEAEEELLPVDRHGISHAVDH